jgi:hypothetical protein
MVALLRHFARAKRPLHGSKRIFRTLHINNVASVMKIHNFLTHRVTYPHKKCAYGA